MPAETLQTICVLLLGFAVAGLLASGFQMVMARPASFNIFGDGTRPAAIAQVPFLVFAAPFIIIRNTVFGRRAGDRQFLAVMTATIVSGFWSLMSGTVVVMALEAVGVLSA